VRRELVDEINEVRSAPSQTQDVQRKKDFSEITKGPEKQPEIYPERGAATVNHAQAHESRLYSEHALLYDKTLWVLGERSLAWIRELISSGLPLPVQ
jgi:hypothetical protein